MWAKQIFITFTLALVASAQPVIESVKPRLLTPLEGTTVSIKGSGFSPSSRIFIGNLEFRPFSSTPDSLLFSFNSFGSAGTGDFSLRVFEADQPSNSVTISVRPPIPILGDLSGYTSVPAGSGSLEFRASGSGFAGNAYVTWNGRKVLVQGPVLGVQIPFTIPAIDLANPSVAQVQVVNPGEEGGPSNIVAFTVAPQPFMNDAVWLPSLGRFAASVNSRSKVNPQSVILLDPSSGKVESAVPFDSEPMRVAASDDGQYLYVSSADLPIVRQYRLPSMTVVRDINLGVKPFGVDCATKVALSMAVMPGNPSILVVSLGTRGCVIDYDGVVEYIDGVGAPKSIPGRSPNGVGISVIHFGRRPDVIYGLTRDINGAFSRLLVSSDGVTFDRTVRADGAFFGSDFAIVNGKLFASGGIVADPDSGQIIKTIGFSGTAGGDTVNGLVHYANSEAPFSNLLVTVDAGTLAIASTTPIAASNSRTLLRAFDGGALLLGGIDQSIVRIDPAAGFTPSASTTVNSASGRSSFIAPGMLVSLYGSRMANGVLPGIIGPDGLVTTNLGGTRVLFNRIPAPLLYVSPSQVNVIVPFGVAGRAYVEVQVEVNGAPLPAFRLAVFDAWPALFTTDGQQAAALNQDNSVNSPSNRAPAGTIVTVFGTGTGETHPGGVDGAITGSAPPQPAGPVQATIGGIAAQVLYAGDAPQLVSGVTQFNLRIPATVAPAPNIPVVIIVGSIPSASIATIAVR